MCQWVYLLISTLAWPQPNARAQWSPSQSTSPGALTSGHQQPLEQWELEVWVWISLCLVQIQHNQAEHRKSLPLTHALLATCCKHQPWPHYCRQWLWGQNNHWPILLTITFLRFWGLSHHSWYPQGKLHLYPDLMHPRGHISHVHCTASKYPCYSCSNNALGMQNVHGKMESFTWASLSSSAAKVKKNLLALWTRVRWVEKGTVANNEADITLQGKIKD